MATNNNLIVNYINSLYARKMRKESILNQAMEYNEMYINPSYTEEEIEIMVESLYESKVRSKTKITDSLTPPRTLANKFLKSQKENGQHWLYSMERDKFYYSSFSKGPWIKVDDMEVELSIEEYLANINPSVAREGKIQEVKKFLSRQLIRDPRSQRLDVGKYPDHENICLDNGIYNWVDDEFIPWDPVKYTLTMKVPAEYNRNWEENTEICESWDKALHSWLPDNECINFLQEYAGYCLIPSCDFRTACFLVGGGSNGKSLFIDIITQLFGYDLTVNTTLDALGRRFGTTILIDKLLAVCSDLNDGYLANTGVLKQIIAGDPIAAEYKGGKSFDFIPVTKMLLSANKIPKSADKTQGWYSRLKFVPFPYSFKPSPIYKRTLLKKMSSKEGKSVLLGWAIEGLKRLYTNQEFTVSERMNAELENYKNENDNVLFFVNEQLEPAPFVGTAYKQSLLYTTVYDIYKQWCEYNGMRYCSKVEFSSKLADCKIQTKTLSYPNKSKGKWSSAKFLLDTRFKNDNEFDGLKQYKYNNVVGI